MVKKIARLALKKTHTIEFKKQMNWTEKWSYKIVEDSYIINLLNELQKKYDFEIVNVNLKDTSSSSRIKIKCSKSEKVKIFADFTAKLSGYINETKFR